MPYRRIGQSMCPVPYSSLKIWKLRTAAEHWNTERGISNDCLFESHNIKSGLKVWPVVSGAIVVSVLKTSLVLAQVTPAITPTTGPGNLGTTVTQAGNTYQITGGTRPSNGPNLFHSFGEFGVPTNHLANFLNDTALPTSNILGRVTGGNPSNIFGTIQTTGFGSANLFLMNPAGIVFGPNASLNVGGSATFTTADYLRLADGAKFNAMPGPQDASISSAPVAAFGFLGSNPAAITVQGGQLAVSEGQASRSSAGISTSRPARWRMAPHSQRSSRRQAAKSIWSVLPRRERCCRAR